MTADDPSLAKKTLRPQALAARRQAHLALAGDAARRVRDHVLDSGLTARVAAGYWPMGDELDIRPLLQALAGQGGAVALPVVVAPRRPLVFRAWTPGAPLQAGAHGTRHPAADAAVLVPDLLLVPLLAFDDRGYRLGYGGGYYDRTIQALRAERSLTVLGVAYAAQRLDAVPHDGNDQVMDGVVTELGVTRYR